MTRALLACTALVAAAWTAPAHAQWLVSDPLTETGTWATVAKDAIVVENTATQIDNQVTQIERATSTVNAIAHGNLYAVTSLAPELAGLGLTDPLGADGATIGNVVSGAGTVAGQLGSLGRQFLSQVQFFRPAGGDLRAQFINRDAQAAAGQLAVASQIVDSTHQRMALLPQVISAAGSAPDIKASMDANARLTGEAAQNLSQLTQVTAIGVQQRALDAANASREEQVWRCSAERLVQDAQAGSATAGAGTVTLVNSSLSGVDCTVNTSASGGGGAPGTGGGDTGGTGSGAGVVTASAPGGDDGGVLGTMTAQSWGGQAAANAQAMGVNPAALAATCVIESNCANVPAPGNGQTVSGPFQMTNATYASDLNQALGQNPGLASSAGNKSDPTTESIAAA